MSRLMIFRKGAPVMAALIGVAGTSLLPIASADPLPNGYDVSCKQVNPTQVMCYTSGCPRVQGDEAGDVIHTRVNALPQSEIGHQCGSTSAEIVNLSSSFTYAVQGCRKHMTTSDDCGAWSNYTFTPPAQPAAPAPAPAPAPNANFPVHCSAGYTLPPGSDCSKTPNPNPPAPVAVTNAIKAKFDDPPGLHKVVLRVENSSNLTAACHYDAKANTNNPLVKKDTTRDFTVPANGKDAEEFDGALSGTTYTVTITCKDASGKQTQDIGDQNLTLKW
jgi:hypothetical protein